MIRPLVVLATSLSVAANAAVIRHDVDDAKYRIAASEFAALVDMPGAGHGTLIAPRWVVTAAHTIQPGQVLRQVIINGQQRAVERVVVHPGYKAVPQDLVDQAMATGEAVLIVTFQRLPTTLPLSNSKIQSAASNLSDYMRETMNLGRYSDSWAKVQLASELKDTVPRPRSARSLGKASTRSQVLTIAGSAISLTRAKKRSRSRQLAAMETAAGRRLSRPTANGYSRA